MKRQTDPYGKAMKKLTARIMKKKGTYYIHIAHLLKYIFFVVFFGFLLHHLAVRIS